MEQKRKIVFLLLLPPRPSWTKVFGDQVGLFIQQLFFATEGLPTYLPTLQANEQTSKRYVGLILSLETYIIPVFFQKFNQCMTKLIL